MPGWWLLVSHDRDFLDALRAHHRDWKVTASTVYAGGWTDYLGTAPQG